MLRATKTPRPVHRDDTANDGSSGAGRDADVSTARVEAFSDGVFAIAITLLILEIKVPQLNAADSAMAGTSLARALLELWPSYFAYVFSFLVIGIYWANHHAIFRLYERSNHSFVLLNVFFLGCISFLPFPTSVLAQYITDELHRHDAIVFYAFGLFLPALAWLLMWLYASHGHRLLDSRLDPRFVKAQTRRFMLTCGVYLSAVGLAAWNSLAGLLLCVSLTLLYLLPPTNPTRYNHENYGNEI